ncbi:GNAT family N-acetyltransferase [Stieleria neptunia]|uniref:GNAT family N-acetyltransferase n=1 Tax=Stieleria neptunia TaxID=2527979 RepID=UPI0011AAAFFF|nr:GNAT family N-acetyltransferase [Stieleria neptunia]
MTTDNVLRFFEMVSGELSSAFDEPDDWWQCDGTGCSRIELFEDPCRPNTIYIRNLETDIEHRGQGHAKRLLRKVCGVAGKCEVDLSLHVEDTPKSDCRMLVDWYRREGFRGDMHEMIWHHNPSE